MRKSYETAHTVHGGEVTWNIYISRLDIFRIFGGKQPTCFYIILTKYLPVKVVKLYIFEY